MCEFTLTLRRLSADDSDQVTRRTRSFGVTSMPTLLRCQGIRTTSSGTAHRQSSSSLVHSAHSSTCPAKRISIERSNTSTANHFALRTPSAPTWYAGFAERTMTSRPVSVLSEAPVCTENGSELKGRLIPRYPRPSTQAWSRLLPNLRWDPPRV